MPASSPTGTIPPTAEAILTVLKSMFHEELFTYQEARDVLTTSAVDDTIPQQEAETVDSLSEQEIDHYLGMLELNGYLYQVDDQLRITPRV